MEALVAYDCSGAVLLMGTLVGGLITGTCSGVWAWFKWRDRMIMVGSTTMLMGMVLVRDLNKVDSYIYLLLILDDWNFLVLATYLGSQDRVSLVKSYQGSLSSLDSI